MSRYAEMFSAARGRGVFVPFFMIGDPDLPTSLALMEAAVASGADALELGIPFSDPVADGPIIQAAAERALQQRVRPRAALDLVREFRARNPRVPVGLLVYANLVFGPGVAEFYRAAARAGVDSVLVADVPAREGGPFVTAAHAAGIAPVFIVPPDASPSTLERIAKMSAGYTYCLTRSGVTGTTEAPQLDHKALFSRLRDHGAPPPLLGFGISTPAHVRDAVAAGAAGAISGSAVVQRIADHLHDSSLMLESVTAFVQAMRDAL
jgi:tryptophan synthase alpha chain